MREPPLLHGTIVGNGVVMLLTPAYQPSPDTGGFALWGEASPSIHPSSSILRRLTSGIWRSPTLHLASITVTPSTQRLVSGIVLVPAIMSSIWYAPREAILLLVSIATTVASYEFAWLSFRIVKRVEKLFQYYEGQPGPVIQSQQSIHLSQASNTGSDEEESTFEPAVVVTDQCVVTPLARILFYEGNQWLAALVLALPTSMVLVGIDGRVLNHVRPDQPLDTFVWAYLIPTRYLTALCGWFAPNWQWMVLILWQSQVFSVMAMLVQSCPVAIFSCGDSYLFTVFVVGCFGILLFCTIIGQRMLVVQAALAVTGFLLVHGLGLTLVSLLDLDDLERSRVTTTLLLTIFWAAQISSYTWKRLAAPWWGQSTPLCSQVSSRFDLESLLVAIGVGVCIAVFTLHFNSLPGDNTGVYSLLAAVGVILMHVGELVIELLGRAAGIQYTGTSLPGKRGFLERITVLVFAVVVFLPYLAAQSID
ncbi:hypothetical protein P3T76_005211 [Phytophthora citrophthora]|uniref:Uncharacterized protein n=1 Tax=Phytophthora citrophthora TaxID=4793 RepID=A0AAD9GSK7_9STRA|nr:hypothetical protein P3T76_005211 [Phytophthora citrophthora]